MREEFHKLHQARRPSRVATTVYGNDDGIISCVLRSNCCKTRPSPESRSTTLSERLFATSNRSLPLPEITASPAGYGIAVPGAVLRTPKATFLPAAIFWGAIFRKRSGFTLPFSNL